MSIYATIAWKHLFCVRKNGRCAAHMRTNYQLSEYNAIYGKKAFFNIQFFTLHPKRISLYISFRFSFVSCAMCINFHFSTRFKI